MRRLDFTATTAGFAVALAHQPDAGERLKAALVAALAVLDSDRDDERIWKISAAHEWPQDSIHISITPTGQVVRGELPRIAPALIPRKEIA